MMMSFAFFFHARFVFTISILRNLHRTTTMKTVVALTLLAAPAAAFFNMKPAATKVVKPVFSVDTIPGVIEPTGLFDPLGFAAKADEATLKRYREAELTHGRVAMLATVGFLVGEAVESKTFLFNGEITGPAITHLAQVNPSFWLILGVGIARAELDRAKIGWVEPEDTPVAKPGLLRADYIPGNIGFDPLSLKPEDPEEFFAMQTKELQNGRLAMLAAAGFLAQELVDGKGILEHFSA
jgi:hypothetical protein